jgi:signal transduction histidine kinase
VGERFFRARNVNPRQISGVGIGLYVMRQIVEAHGGTLDLQSREGAGTTVTVRLPRRAS